MKDDTLGIGRLFSLSRDPVVCTRDWRITYMNPAAAEMFGGDFSGRLISELLPRALLDEDAAPYAAAAVIAGKHATVTCTPYEDLRLYSFIIPDPPMEKPTELPFSVSMREITNIIKITADQMMNQSEQYRDEKMDRYAAVMKHSSSKLKRLVNSYSLLVACLEGSQPFRPVMADIGELCALVVETAADLAEARGIELVFTGQESISAAVDPELLQVMLLNLLSNSLTHTQPGGKITVDLRATASHFTITVTDNGTGIPPEKLSTVFARYREPVQLNAGSPTAGMGLAVAEQIAQLHGGTVMVQSMPGKGTTIAARLARQEQTALKTPWSRYGNDITERVMTELSTWLTWKDYQKSFTD